MCGLKKQVKKIVGGALKHPLSTIGDIAAVSTGNPWLAAAGGGLDKATHGGSIGQSLISAGTHGLGAYAANNAADFIGEQFPETASSFSNTVSNLIPSNPFPETTNAISTAFDTNIGTPVSNAYRSLEDSLGFGSGGGAVGSSGVGNIASPSNIDAATIAGSVPGTQSVLGEESYLPQGFNLGSNQIANPFEVNPASAVTSAPASAAGSSSGFRGMLDKLGVTPMQALSGAGMAASLLKGSPDTKAEKAQSQIGAEQKAQAEQMIADAKAGRLPAGMDQTIEQQTQDAINAIKSKYAQMGMSGSSSELAAIQQAQAAASQYKSQQLSAMLQQGLSALGEAGGTEQQIIQNQLANDQSLYQALAGLAGITGFGQSKQAAA